MRVKDLIKILKSCPQDSLVVLAKDEEGNSFSPIPDDNKKQIYSYSEGVYVPDSTWSGEFHDEQGLKEWYGNDIPKGAKKAICLWPTN